MLKYVFKPFKIIREALTGEQAKEQQRLLRESRIVWVEIEKALKELAKAGLIEQGKDFHIKPYCCFYGPAGEALKKHYPQLWNKYLFQLGQEKKFFGVTLSEIYNADDGAFLAGYNSQKITQD